MYEGCKCLAEGCDRHCYKIRKCTLCDIVLLYQLHWKSCWVLPFFRKPLTLRHFIKIEEETRKTTKQHWHTKNASHKTNNTWKATRIYCVCMAHKQREGGGTICPAVTFGKYGFTLTERKLSPHEQKLWPLAIRRGGGGSLFGQMAYLNQLGLAWLAFIVAWTFCYFAILLPDIVNYRPPSAKQFHILAVWLMQARNQLSKWHLVWYVQSVACVVTNWIFLATQRYQKENEDWRQNMVDFKSEIRQTFDWFPPPCKICQRLATWPLVGHQINLGVLRRGDLPFCILWEGDLGFENGCWEKRVLVNPWLMAKYATKAASSTLSDPPNKKCRKSST